MNYSKYFVSCLFTAALAFAQFPWETPSATEGGASGSSSSEISYAPVSSSSAEAKSVAPAGKTVFDNLRGHAYNPYSTQGAASTVEDLITLPGDIYGKKFFYVSPTEYLGYTAFDLFGGSTLLGLDNSSIGSPAALILGYATPVFGFALNYSVSKVWNSNSDTDVSTRTTYPGDNIGLYFSMPLGFANLYANAGWLTYDQSTSADYDGNETQEDYSTIDASVGLTGDIGSLSYDAFFGFVRTGGTFINDDGDKAVDENTSLALALGFNLGYTALQSSTARIIVGLNNAVGIAFSDDVNNIQEGDNVIGLIISPNILGEVILFDNWLAFAGANHSLIFAAGDKDGDDDTSLSQLRHTPRTETIVGLRYQKTNWALESQVSANPFEALNGENIFASFGGFIYF